MVAEGEGALVGAAESLEGMIGLSAPDNLVRGLAEEGRSSEGRGGEVPGASLVDWGLGRDG